MCVELGVSHGSMMVDVRGCSSFDCCEVAMEEVAMEERRESVGRLDCCCVCSSSVWHAHCASVAMAAVLLRAASPFLAFYCCCQPPLLSRADGFPGF